MPPSSGCHVTFLLINSYSLKGIFSFLNTLFLSNPYAQGGAQAQTPRSRVAPSTNRTSQVNFYKTHRDAVCPLLWTAVHVRGVISLVIWDLVGSTRESRHLNQNSQPWRPFGLLVTWRIYQYGWQRKERGIFQRNGQCGILGCHVGLEPPPDPHCGAICSDHDPGNYGERLVLFWGQPHSGNGPLYFVHCVLQEEARQIG